MTHLPIVNLGGGVYFDGTCMTRDLIESSKMLVLPWGIVPASRELCDFGVDGQGSHPCYAALGMSKADWRIGATFSQATSWDSLTIPLSHVRYRATRGEGITDGAAHAFYTGLNANFTVYSGWVGAAPTLHDPAGADQGGAQFTDDTTGVWIMAWQSNRYWAFENPGVITGWNWNANSTAANLIAAAEASTHKVYIGIVATGPVQIYACEGEAGLNPILIREINPGDNPTVMVNPFWYIMIKRKPGQAARLVSVRQFVKGTEITGFGWFLPSYMPKSCTLAITASPGLNITGEYPPFSTSLSYNSTTGLGTAPIIGRDTNADWRINLIRVNGFNGQRSIPADGYQLKLEVPDDADYGTRAQYGRNTKQFVDDWIGLGGAGARTLDLSTRAVQSAGHHYRIPASELPAANQPWEAGLSPEYLVDIHKLLPTTQKMLWKVFPHGCGPDYIAQWIVRAHTARGATKLLIGCEYSNEPWHNNPKFASTYVGYAEGPGGDNRAWYSERMHDIVDALDIALPNWRTLDIMLIAQWQTGMNKETRSTILGRKRGGVSLAARCNGALGLANAPYWAGGVGGEVYNLWAQKVLDQCVAQGVSINDKPGIKTVVHNMMLTSQAAAIAEMASFTSLNAEWCIEQGLAFNAIRNVCYEWNEHFQDSVQSITYQGVALSGGINHASMDDFRMALYEYRRGPQEAEMARVHSMALAQYGYEAAGFYKGLCDLGDDELRTSNSNWGLSAYQGRMPRSPKYLKLAEANAVHDATNIAEAAAIAAKIPRKLRRGVRR